MRVENDGLVDSSMRERRNVHDVHVGHDAIASAVAFEEDGALWKVPDSSDCAETRDGFWILYMADSRTIVDDVLRECPA